MVEWYPTIHDLEWTEQLFKSLKNGGIWKFSTGAEGEHVGNTNATFTRKGEEMELTDIHIENMAESPILMDRIQKAKICFEEVGVPCKTDNSVDTAFIDMVSKK